MKLIIFISFIITLVCICVYNYSFTKSNKQNEWSWYCSCQTNNMNGEMNYVMNKYLHKHTSKYIYVPCGYDYITNEILNINKVSQHISKENKYYYILHGADELATKNILWNNLKEYYNINASKYMPNTYIVKDTKDMERFKIEYDNNKQYILKKNIQRQSGIHISRSYNEIMRTIQKGDEENKKYSVVQELLTNPYLINGRKINLRVYILIVCTETDKQIYVFDDGFMYYTKNTFVPNSDDIDANITTGYIDRQVYVDNPLTLHDFKKHLKDKANNTFNKIHLMIKDIMRANIENINKDKSCEIGFQLFGADIALDVNLEPKLMEINKGPDFMGKDKRDTKVKRKCAKDILGILGIINSTDNGFVRL